MTENQMEDYVKRRFGTDLYEFIKNKVEEESLYDYEVATLLNVNSIHIGRLRSDYGLKRKNGFSRRFERTYGPGAVETFRTMVENPDISLSDLARHFGFSRQNASLAYKKLYGCLYTEADKKMEWSGKKKTNQERRRI